MRDIWGNHKISVSIFASEKKKCFLQESIFGNCKLTTHGLNNSHFELMNEITNGLNIPNLERIKPNQVSN